MELRSFCYWLQGLFELCPDVKTLNEAQTSAIKRHLALVFKHEIDPGIDGGDSVKAAELQAVHDGTQPVDLAPGAVSFSPRPPGMRC